MFGWLKELLEIRYEFKERKLRLNESHIENQNVCMSCETLREQLTQANYERKRLLDELLKENVVVEEMQPAEKPKPLMPRHGIWRHKQAALEAEDRAQAIKLAKFKEEEAEARKAKLNTADLEKQVLGESNAS